MSLRGPASGTFRTGRYSKLLPSGLAVKYREALADPELLALRDEVALLDARMGQLLGRLDHDESEGHWQDAFAALGRYKAARQSGQRADQEATFRELERIIRGGADDVRAWAEIRSLIEDRRRAVESERRRLVDMQQVLNVGQAMTLLALVVDTVRKHVRDRDALAAISRELDGLVAARSLPPVGAGGDGAAV